MHNATQRLARRNRWDLSEIVPYVLAITLILLSSALTKLDRSFLDAITRNPFRDAPLFHVPEPAAPPTANRPSPASGRAARPDVSRAR